MTNLHTTPKRVNTGHHTSQPTATPRVAARYVRLGIQDFTKYSSEYRPAKTQTDGEKLENEGTQIKTRSTGSTIVFERCFRLEGRKLRDPAARMCLRLQKRVRKEAARERIKTPLTRAKKEYF